MHSSAKCFHLHEMYGTNLHPKSNFYPWFLVYPIRKGKKMASHISHSMQLLTLVFLALLVGCKSDNLVANTNVLSAQEPDSLSQLSSSSDIAEISLSTSLETSSSSGLNGNRLPVGVFDSPMANQEILAPASLAVEVSATDPDGSVASVQLVVNDYPIGKLTSAPYEWNVDGLSEGFYQLRAEIADDSGAIQVIETVVHVLAASLQSSSSGASSSAGIPPRSSITIASSSAGIPPRSSITIASSSAGIPPRSSITIASSSAGIPPKSSAVIAISSSAASTTATGTVTVSYTPITDGGQYSPRNANATWIQQGNTWIANITAHAKSYAKYVNLWRSVYTKTITTGVDGVAGASQNAFSAQTGSWNVTGKAFGTYRLYMQFATENANGKSAFVDFSLRSTGIDTTIATLSPYFTKVRIVHVP
jgi:hypothetical protein